MFAATNDAVSGGLRKAANSLYLHNIGLLTVNAGVIHYYRRSITTKLLTFDLPLVPFYLHTDGIAKSLQ